MTVEGQRVGVLVVNEGINRSGAPMSNDPVTLQIPKVTDAPVTLQLPAYTPDLYGAVDPAWLAGQKGHAWRRPPAAAPYYYPPRPARLRRRPAPLGLRIFVSLLFVLFMAALSGLVIIHYRPSWVRSFRNYLTFSPAKPTAVPVAPFHAAPGGLKYFVPASSYSIGIDISHPCWITVNQLGTGATLFAETLQPTPVEQFIRVTGSTSIKVAARTNSITIREGQHTLGNIQNPVVGATYDLLAQPR